MDLAVEEINQEGGVLGDRPLVLEYRDTGTRVEQGKVAARDLIEGQGVYALLGPVSSAVALGLVPIITETETVMLSPAASSPQLTQDGGAYFFRNYPSDVVEGHTMAEFCRKNAIASVAILAADDIFGNGIADVFTDKYEASTRSVVMRENFGPPLTQEQASEMAEAVVDSDAAAVYIAAYQSDVEMILRALDGAGSTIPRLSTSAVTRDIVEAAGEAANGLIFPQTSFNPQDSRNERVRTFVEAYQERYGELPGNYAAHAYDAVHVLAKAIDRSQIRSKMRSAMRNVKHQGVTGMIDFDLSGDVVLAPRLYAILNGEVMTFADYKDAKVGQSILGS
jgi:branched-chain amino acid transport system substrate-binding protein